MNNLINVSNKRVLKELKLAGWQPGRDIAEYEQAFIDYFGAQWLPSASMFIRCLGGLDIAHTLNVWDRPYMEHDLSRLGDRITATINSRVVPTATSNYIGDGCLIWVDEKGRFYAVDSDGMVFIAHDVNTALNVLIDAASRPEPPSELREKLLEAYDWSNQKEHIH